MSERDGEILDFLRSRFAHVEERLDRIDTRLDERTQWVGQDRAPSRRPAPQDRLHQHLDTLDQRVNRIERRLEPSGDSVDALRQSL